MKKEKTAENKKGSRKQKKQWALILSMALCIGTLCMAVPVYADAEAERTRIHAVDYYCSGEHTLNMPVKARNKYNIKCNLAACSKEAD